jgi:hypothetical protein
MEPNVLIQKRMFHSMVWLQNLLHLTLIHEVPYLIPRLVSLLDNLTQRKIYLQVILLVDNQLKILLLNH